jgi:2-polyprenyl-3-methyl-5-hydroxy-6-metoxy-1,4-benzoquinol methylase
MLSLFNWTSAPWSLNRTFDLVLCLEVLEHLGEDVEPLLCDGLARHARRWLVVTAAAWPEADITSI